MEPEKEVLNKEEAREGNPDEEQESGKEVSIKEDTTMEVSEGNSETDKELANKTAETSEFDTSKRVNKRKQRFPTKQTELMKRITGVRQTKPDTPQTPLTKNVNEKKGKIETEGMSGNQDKANAEVVLRRSSRTPKKKKMFDEVDEPEPNIKPEVKRIKKAKVIKTKPVKKTTPIEVNKIKKPLDAEKQSLAADEDQPEETSESEIDKACENNESVSDVNLELKKENADNYVTDKENEDIVKVEYALDGTEIEERETEADLKEKKTVEGETSGEEKNDKENKDTKIFKKLKKSTQCKICEKLLSSPKALRRHMFAVHDDGKEEFFCKECDARLKSKKSFDRHLLLHSEDKYKCYECGRSFVSHGSVKNHAKIAHAGMMPFKCHYENCDKRFSNTSNRKKHIEAVHLNIRSHYCYLCPKGFKNSSALTVHLYSCHSEHFGDRPKFECNVCHKVFTQRLKLRMHESVHTASKPYKCKYEDCGKKFRLKSNRMKHERVHDNIQPFVCATCGQSFSRRIYLETHQYKHTGVKNFQCSLCQKTFSQKGNLDIHMKIHSENREFVSCNKCGKAFSNKSNLTKHMLSICEKPLQGHHLYDHRTNMTIKLKSENGDSIILPPPADAANADSNISFILREVSDVETNNTVVIIQGDENGQPKSHKANEMDANNTVVIIQDNKNGELKSDKACGRDEARTLEYLQQSKSNVVQTVNKPTLVKQSDIAMINAATKVHQTQPNIEMMTQAAAETQVISDTSQVVEQVPDTATVYLEQPTADGVQVVPQEQIIEHVTEQDTVYMTYSEPTSVPATSSSLADIVLPSSSENVEYEIVSSGLDGVEEGILKEFLSKWNQQGTMAGTTLILDVQNRDEVQGTEGVNVSDSVQYIVTVKDQE